MNSDGRSTSQQLYIPTLLVVGASPSLVTKCITAGDSSGLGVKTCSLGEAPAQVPLRHPLAIVVPNHVFESTSDDLAALARDVRSVLVPVDADVTVRELEHMFAAAIAASSGHRERRRGAGRYSITEGFAEEAPFSRRSEGRPSWTPNPPSHNPPSRRSGEVRDSLPPVSRRPGEVRDSLPPVSRRPAEARDSLPPPSMRPVEARQSIPPASRASLSTRQLLPRVTPPVGTPATPGLASARPAPKPAESEWVTVDDLPTVRPPPPDAVSEDDRDTVRPEPGPGLRKVEIPRARTPDLDPGEARVSEAPPRATDPPCSGTKPLERPSYAALRAVFSGR